MTKPPEEANLPPKFSGIRILANRDDARVARLDIRADGLEHSYLVTREALEMIAAHCHEHALKMERGQKLN